VFHAGRLFAVLVKINAQVTEVCRKRKVIDTDLGVCFIDMLGHNNAVLTRGKIMFLLARYFTRMAACAVIIIDE